MSKCQDRSLLPSPSFRQAVSGGGPNYTGCEARRTSGAASRPAVPWPNPSRPICTAHRTATRQGLPFRPSSASHPQAAAHLPRVRQRRRAHVHPPPHPLYPVLPRAPAPAAPTHPLSDPRATAARPPQGLRRAAPVPGAERPQHTHPQAVRAARAHTLSPRTRLASFGRGLMRDSWRGHAARGLLHHSSRARAHARTHAHTTRNAAATLGRPCQALPPRGWWHAAAAQARPSIGAEAAAGGRRRMSGPFHRPRCNMSMGRVAHVLDPALLCEAAPFARARSSSRDGLCTGVAVRPLPCARRSSAPQRRKSRGAGRCTERCLPV